MKLTDDARNWHRLWSVRLIIVTGLLGVLESTLPAWQKALPENIFLPMAAITLTAAGFARVIKQSLPDHDKGGRK